MTTDIRPFVSRLAARWEATAPAERVREVDGTLVSADLSGFTTLSERLAGRGREGAERVTAMVNQCFTALLEEAECRGGDVLKFGGDAVLVLFDGDDHTLRAGACAVAMQHRIAAPTFARLGLRMSVGIHSSVFPFFLVGDEHRHLLIAGPPASRVSEMEAAASAGEVLVSADVAARLPAGLADRPRPDGDALLRTDAAWPGGGDAPAPYPDDPSPRLLAPPIVAVLDALAGAGGEHRLASIGFLKLTGTDELLERAGVDALAGALDELITLLTPIAARYGVTLLDTDIIAGGVKLMLGAGVPASTGDEEEALLRCALDLVRHSSRPLRVGCTSGPLFAGFLGGPHRRCYTVMGDVVNLAARLSVRAAPGTVLATAEVLKASRSQFATTAEPLFLVKGRKTPVEAVVVTGLADAAGMAPLGAAALPLVGRAHEIDVLRDAARDVTRGRGRTVEIAGEAGIGKTRLVQAVADDTRLLLRLTAAGQPYGSFHPYFAVRSVVRAITGIDPDVDARVAGEQLVEWVRHAAPALAPLVPLLSVPANATVPNTPEADAIGEEFRQARAHDLLVDLAAATLRTPTLVVVEDAHWLDGPSLELVRQLAARAESHPWLVLVTRRPGGSPVVGDGIPGVRLELGTLPDDETRALAAAAGPALGEAQIEALVARSAGNPLFALELAAAADERSGALPESVERLIATRIDRLDPTDRMRLRYASVIGPRFDAAIADDLVRRTRLGPAGEEGWSRLRDFVDHAEGRVLQFRHMLIRDVAYEGLPFQIRRSLHRHIGQILERTTPDDVALLATHFSLGGPPRKTWRYATEAGHRARTGSAPIEAAAHYRRALDAARRSSVADAAEESAVAEALGDVLELAGHYDDAFDAYARARRFRPEAADQADLMRKQGMTRERAGRYGPALAWHTRASALVADDATERALTVRSLIALASASVRHRQGQHHEAIAQATRAVDDAKAAGAQRVLGRAYQLLHLSAVYVGHPQARAWGDSALAITHELDDPSGEANTRNNIGLEAYYAGRWNEAVAEWEAAARLQARIGDVVGELTAVQNIAEIRSDQGRLDEAEAGFDRALRGFRAARYEFGVAVALANLGRLSIRRGRWSDGTAHLDDADRRFRSLGADPSIVDVAVRRAEGAVLAGDSPRAAFTIAAVAGDVARLEGDAALQAFFHRIAGFAAFQSGDLDRAAQSFRASLRGAEAAGAEFEAAQTLAAMAALATHRADRHGEAYAAESTRLLERLGVVSLPAVPLPEGH